MTTTEADQHTPTGTEVTSTACGTCAYADEHGWWGREGSHHRTCHRDWRGTGQMHCASCCAHFTSAYACDLHRQSGHCVDPSTVRNKAGVLQLVSVDRWGGPAWASVYRGRRANL